MFKFKVWVFTRTAWPKILRLGQKIRIIDTAMLMEACVVLLRVSYRMFHKQGISGQHRTGRAKIYILDSIYAATLMEAFVVLWSHLRDDPISGIIMHGIGGILLSSHSDDAMLDATLSLSHIVILWTLHAAALGFETGTTEFLSSILFKALEKFLYPTCSASFSIIECHFYVE